MESYISMDKTYPRKRHNIYTKLHICNFLRSEERLVPSNPYSKINIGPPSSFRDVLRVTVHAPDYWVSSDIRSHSNRVNICAIENIELGIFALGAEGPAAERSAERTAILNASHAPLQDLLLYLRPRAL